jgi:pimeloyl-ACP methyl ester carboxylesterase
MSLLDRLVFRPGRGRSRDLATLDFRFEDAWLEAEDGVRLHAFWLPDTSARPTERALLLLHGNAGDATRRLPNADRQRRLGADVLLLDYRGYGRSEGRPTEAGIYADARAALDHLTKQRGIAAERIVVFGSSLGSAVAVDLARGRELAGLVVESGFPDMAAIARSFIGIGFQRWLGRKLASASKITELRCPLLFVHGGRTASSGRRSAAPSTTRLPAPRPSTSSPTHAITTRLMSAVTPTSNASEASWTRPYRLRRARAEQTGSRGPEEPSSIGPTQHGVARQRLTLDVASGPERAVEPGRVRAVATRMGLRSARSARSGEHVQDERSLRFGVRLAVAAMFRGEPTLQGVVGRCEGRVGA